MLTKHSFWLSFKPEWLHLDIDETETAALSLIQAFLKGQRFNASKIVSKASHMEFMVSTRTYFSVDAPPDYPIAGISLLDYAL